MDTPVPVKSLNFWQVVAKLVLEWVTTISRDFVEEGHPPTHLSQSLTQNFLTSEKSSKWKIQSVSTGSLVTVGIKVDVKGNT